MNKQLSVQDLGLKDYKETWDYQEVLFKNTIDIKIKNRRESRNNTLNFIGISSGYDSY